MADAHAAPAPAPYAPGPHPPPQPPVAPQPPAAAAASRESPEPCVTCGRPAGSAYCPHCGERRAADRRYTLGALAEEAVDALSPADGRGLRTAWLLLRRPGALTAAYVRGVRQPYLAPLKLFLLVNLAYFAFVAVTHQPVFTTRLVSHLYRSPYEATAQRLVAARLAARGTTEAAYRERFDAAAETQAKSLVGLLVPGFALAVALVQVRRRRPALHHLTFALHSVAALLVVLMVCGVTVFPLAELAVQRSGLDPDGELADALTAMPLLLVWGAWLAAGSRAAYGDGWAAAAAKAAALLVGFMGVLGVYRALLFVVTFATT